MEKIQFSAVYALVFFVLCFKKSIQGYNNAIIFVFSDDILLNSIISYKMVIKVLNKFYLFVCLVRFYKFCISLLRTELAISDYVWGFFLPFRCKQHHLL